MSFKKIFVSKINQQFKCDAKPTQMGGFDFSFSKKIGSLKQMIF